MSQENLALTNESSRHVNPDDMSEEWLNIRESGLEKYLMDITIDLLDRNKKFFDIGQIPPPWISSTQQWIDIQNALKLIHAHYDIDNPKAKEFIESLDEGVNDGTTRLLLAIANNIFYSQPEERIRKIMEHWYHKAGAGNKERLEIVNMVRGLQRQLDE